MKASIRGVDLESAWQVAGADADSTGFEKEKP
jgi:hypothetical protein